MKQKRAGFAPAAEKVMDFESLDAWLEQLKPAPIFQRTDEGEVFAAPGPWDLRRR